MSLQVWTVAFDFAQIEARIIGMAAKDEVFAEAILTGHDLHYDWAERFLCEYPPLAGLSHIDDIKENHIKKFRGRVKNQVVFPWIYDSSPRSTAKLLDMPEDLVLELYDTFWEEFWQIKEWKKQAHKDYFKNGYVSTLYGSRRHGPLSFTKRVNTIVQGTGGYINMAAMNRLSLAAYEQGKSYYQARINIHDDLTFGIPDAHLDDAIPFIAREMCRKTHNFMWKIPLQVEVSVGKNWADLEEITKFDTRDFDYKEAV